VANPNPVLPPIRSFDRTCDACGCRFASKTRGRPARFCSKACRARHYYEQIRSEPVPFTCVWCFGSAVGQRGQILCSTQCRNRRSSHRAEHGHVDRCDIPWKPCDGCGAVGSFFQHRRFCADCRAEHRRAHWRRKNAVRRGAKVKGERFSIEQVGDRDGWRCHLCGKRVDPSIANPDPRAPTIDHLIPVADGGLDELSNVALAHRSCNCARGARGMAQLRLAV